MIIAVDFDGTIVEDKWPEIGAPKWNVINWCKNQKNLGNQLILWTCRSNGSLERAVKACKSFGLTFDAINENIEERTALYGHDCRKIGADIYLDDKNMLVEGII